MPGQVQLANADKSYIRHVTFIEPGEYEPYSNGRYETFVVRCREDNTATDVYNLKGSGDVTHELETLQSTGQSAFSEHIKTLKKGESLTIKLVTRSHLIAILIVSHWVEIAPRKVSKD